MAYDKGDKIRCTGTFTNTAGVATDPTVVLFKFITPAGVSTTYTYGTDAQVVKTATGIYYVDLALSTSGAWSYRWEGSGAIVAAVESSVFVLRGQFA